MIAVGLLKDFRKMIFCATMGQVAIVFSWVGSLDRRLGSCPSLTHCTDCLYTDSRLKPSSGVKPLTPTVAIWVPGPDRVKPLFAILTSGHSAAQP